MSDSSARIDGLVVATHRREFDVALADGTQVACMLKGRALQIAVGDRVAVRRVPGGGAIDEVLPRTNLIYRSDSFREKLLAANVTQIAGVVAPDLPVDDELIHRWMIAAESAECRFVLLANKADLPSIAQMRARLAPIAALGYPLVEFSARFDATPARPWLDGQRTVLIGQSGMGKSTLINALLPGAGVRTTEISAALKTGRHTTTAATLYRLSGDAWVVDSPGVKVFGLAHLTPERIAEAFVELRPYLGHCRFRDCRHGAEPGCAITAAVADGHVARHRLALLHTLVAEAGGGRR